MRNRKKVGMTVQGCLLTPWFNQFTIQFSLPMHSAPLAMLTEA